MDAITSVANKVCVWVSYFAMLTIVVMTVMVTVDVVATKIGHAIPGMYELCQVILSMFVFCTWAYTQSVHGHIHVVMFVSKMPRVLRFICFGFTSILSTVTLAIATYAVVGAVKNMMASGEATGTLLIPYWPFYIFEVVAFGLLTILLLIDSIKAILAIGNEEFAKEIQANWV